MNAPRVLVVGGVDPTGRAGVARDVSVLESERVEPALVVTVLTVQDASGVRRVQPVAPDVLANSLEAAWNQGGIAAIKIGLVPNAATLEVVRRFLRGLDVPVVVDPVVRSRAGDPLTTEDTRRRLGGLVAEATVVTPNVPELELLAGRPVSSLGERIEAARHVRDERGAEAVLAKGGHGPETPGVDVLVTTQVEKMAFQRLDLSNLSVGRGKGCELATRIAALMAKGLDLALAVRRSRDRLHERLLREAQEAALSPKWQEDLSSYTRTLEQLLAQLRPECVPEVGSNLAYAPADCGNASDVIGLAGRITIAGEWFEVAGRPRRGGPHHTGRIAATAQRGTHRAVWVFNHRYRPECLTSSGAEHVALDRRDEPAGASSMEWMTEAAIRRRGALPAYISDSGMPGKEAMIRILAHSPEDLLDHHQRLHGPGAELAAKIAATATRLAGTREP